MSNVRTRKRMRLNGYDYSQNGIYYITICTKKRTEFLWENGRYFLLPVSRHDVVDLNNSSENFFCESYKLSEYGKIVEIAIKSISKNYSTISIDKYVIMPNHVHMIITISNSVNDYSNAIEISTVLGQMKRWASKQIGFPIWHRSYYDHIIRDDTDYCNTWNYIDENPINWESDEFYIR